MKKSKKYRDTISEEDFTNQTKGETADPQEDSPGDSAKDSVDETLIGMNFEPREKVLDQQEIETPKNLKSSTQSSLSLKAPRG